MAKPTPLVPRSDEAWKDECRALIHGSGDTVPSGYDGTLLALYAAQQTEPVAENGRPYATSRLDVIERPFEFKGGRSVLVRLTRVAFVNLLKARTWHHRGAIDLGVRSEAGRAATFHQGFFDPLPQDPPHFTFGRRG